MESIRTFIAIELEEALQGAIGEVQQKLRREGETMRIVRWVTPENVHLTLKFLGNVDVHRLERIEQVTQEACQGFSPFSLSFGGLGCFPSARRPRVIWIGVGGDTDILAQLHRAIEESLTPLGFPPEARDFSAHLTIGRVRRGAGSGEGRKLGQILSSFEVGTLGHSRVESVSLMKSELHPLGAEYTRLAWVELGRESR